MKTIVECLNEVCLELFKEEPIHVLVVDDDADFLPIAKQCLEDAGNFIVSTATSAEEALEELKRTEFDTVVIDYQMPDKNGLELLREARQRGSDVPFILFTNKGKEEIAIEALNSGVERYVAKQGDTGSVYQELKRSICGVVKNRKAEKFLKESEDRLRLITENMQDVLVLTDGDFKCTYVSSSIKSVLGFEPNEVIGRSLYEFVHPDDLPTVMNAIKQPGEMKLEGKTAVRCRRSDGTIVFVEVRGKILTDQKGNFTSAIVTVCDVTERKETQQALEISEEKYRSLFVNMLNGFAYCQMIWDEKGQPVDFVYLEVNDAFENLTHLKKADVLGKRATEAIPRIKEDHPELFDIFGRVASTGKKEWFEIYFKPLDIWLSISAYSPKENHFAVVFDNITYRRKAERKLRALKEFNERIVDSIDDALLLIDPNDYTIIGVNEVASKQLKRRKEDLIGRTCYEATHQLQAPCKPPHHTCPIRELLKTGKQITVEHTHFDENNNKIFVEVSARQLKNQEGKSVIVHLARDITERKKAEERTRESEEKYRKLFEEAMDAIFIVDAELGTILDCNRAATALTGRTKAELVGMNQLLLHPPEDSAEKVSKTFEQDDVSKEGIVLEDRVITKNGEIKDVTIKSNIFEVSGKKLLRRLFRDVTERKKGLKKIRFQADLLNAVGQAVVAADPKGSIIYWNKAAERVYGWSETEVLGRNVANILLNENAQENVEEVLSHFSSGESWTGEAILPNKDGSFLPVIMTTSPILDDKGELIGVLGVSTDISEQKWMQEVTNNAVEKVTELNEKLHVVESLTRHDIRNKLAALNGRVFLLRKRYADNADAFAHLRELDLLSQQILRLLEFERFYTQVGAEGLSLVQVENTVSEAASLFLDLKGAELVNNCPGLVVLADSLLRQLFYNLMDNSLKYGEKVSKIRIYYVEQENQLLLIYEDNGVGIPEAIRSGLFREGFGRGTGYGLYLIKRICEAYGWTIRETGKEGEGARFTMTVPKASKNGQQGFQIG